MLVVLFGWISDDAYITARYADNLLHGYGPVFNPGEQVQGYTHPLWLLLFTAALAILQEPLFVSVALGALFTLLTFLIIGRALLQLQENQAVAALLFAILTGVLLLSEAWRSFQTGGLENSLTHFLLAVLILELVQNPEVRLRRVALFSGLLILTRPDLAVLVGPLCILMVYLALQRRQYLSILVGFLPVLAWLAFAQLYYGSMLPNTAVAKLGVYSLPDGVARGATYILDWVVYEPLSVSACAVFGYFAVRALRSPWQVCLLAGTGLYVLGVIVGGGDFMRARLLLPAFFVLTLLGTIGLSSLISRERLGNIRPWAAAVACMAAVLFAIAPGQDGKTLPYGISNERLFYSGQSLVFYLNHGELDMGTPRVTSEMVGELRQFAADCGSFSIHENRIGGISYHLGPSVNVIDRLGLTDAYIARLPNSYLLEDPRPGHPYRHIPVSYLGQRSDIRLFRDWEAAVRSGDCGIVTRAQDLATSSDLYSVFDVEEEGNDRLFVAAR